MRNRQQSKIPARHHLQFPPRRHLPVFIPVPGQRHRRRHQSRRPHGLYQRQHTLANDPSAWQFTQAPSPAVARIDSIVRRVASRYQIDPKLVRAIIKLNPIMTPARFLPKEPWG